jgi:integrase
LLSEAIRLHIQEKVSTGKWTPKTQQENEAIYRIFLGILGDIELARLNDRKVFLDYLQILRILPANLNKKPEYRGKTVRKVLEMVRKHPATPLMIRTRNKHMERISTLMDWAAENGYVSRNFARGLLAKEEKEDDEKRDPYSREDLMRLFSSPVYTTKSPLRRPERFWVPLISPFSGLRENEICQLYTDDVCVIDDIPCFNISDDKDKRLKTPASKRTIPIHPVLIRVGFLRYVEEQRRHGQARLWPRLLKGRNGYSTTFERWYSLYNRKYVSEAKEKVFHSGRHTVSHTLKNAGVDIEIREAILGHEEDALSRRYGKKFRPAILLKALKKLNYEDVAEHLKWP